MAIHEDDTCIKVQLAVTTPNLGRAEHSFLKYLQYMTPITNRHDTLNST